MRKSIVNLTLLLLLIFASSCGTTHVSRSSFIEEYSYECIGIAKNGDYIIRSNFTTSGKSIENAINEAQKRVVNEVLFNGVAGDSENRVKDIKPLCDKFPDNDDTKRFFNEFFVNNGKYTLYVGTVHDDIPQVVRLPFGYRIDVNLIIKLNSLRKELENKGIVKSLTDTL